MPHSTYLIIGGGMAADAAVRGIRQVDPHGSIGLISAEPDAPYARPPRSKGLWTGTPLAGIWRGTDRWGVAFHLGRTTRSLDARTKQVIDDQGTASGRPVLNARAAGCRPRRCHGTTRARHRQALCTRTPTLGDARRSKMRGEPSVSALFVRVQGEARAVGC